MPYHRLSKSKRPWPRRLVGDTPGLRARFREEHPTLGIDLEPGSAYRAWLNEHRRAAHPLGRGRRRTTPKRDAPKRLAVARNALLRDSFWAAIQRGEVQGTAWGVGSSKYDYGGWLRSKGIDADTGRMTIDGFAFYKQLLEEQDARNRANRNRRRRPAA
jgi:hypothetical protein